MSATLDIDAFRLLYPEYADPIEYPNIVIETRWAQATVFMPEAGNSLFTDAQWQAGLYMLLAHWVSIGAQTAKGEYPSYVTQGGTSKISVSTAAPPAADSFLWWLQCTPYGAQLAALLRAKAAGGLLVGGQNVTGAYRAPFRRS